MSGENIRIELPGHDLWMSSIKTLYALPEPLEVQRFRDSLCITLQLYPHAAGRLQSGPSGSGVGNHWSIALTCSPVPIEVVRLEAHNVRLQSNRVVQDDIKQYLHLEQDAVTTADQPLLLLKLTIAKKQTVIGVSWHHTLGDAATLLRFMQTLSHAYQGIPPPDPPPTFRKHAFPAPSQELIEKYKPLMPHLARTYHQSELAAQYTDMTRDVVHIDFCAPEAAFRRLAHIVREQTGKRQVSRQDCITAYVVSVLNRCGAGPIVVVTNAVSFRNVAAPFVDSDVAGNPIYIVRTELGDSLRELGGIALAIRQSIERWRDPSFIDKYMSVASQLMLDTANTCRSMFFAAEPGVLSVNSTVVLDWQSVHFGHPDRASFHTSGVNERYLRVFRANPGSHAAEGNDQNRGGNMELSFGVPASLSAKVVDMMATELGSAAFPADVPL